MPRAWSKYFQNSDKGPKKNQEAGNGEVDQLGQRREPGEIKEGARQCLELTRSPSPPFPRLSPPSLSARSVQTPGTTTIC